MVAELLERPKIMLLVSCKEFVKRAEPAHVQEWAAVVRTLNTYSEGTHYLGLIVSSNGFTSGCEPWATSYNLGLIPPLKGKNIAFSPDAVLRMFRRSLAGIHKRVRLKADDLLTAPAFFDFVYSLVSDFEGHEEVAQDGRYYTLPRNWVSSFGEMYSALAGHKVQNLASLIYLRLIDVKIWPKLYGQFLKYNGLVKMLTYTCERALFSLAKFICLRAKL